jgi:hypothetical protein
MYKFFINKYIKKFIGSINIAIMIQIEKRQTFPKNFFRLGITKPKILFERKIIFIPNFFHRIISICLKGDLKLIKGWHKSGHWILNKSFSFSAFNYDFFFNTRFLLSLILFFKKKNSINLKKNEIILFGPWPNIYFHKIYDFVIRIVYLQIYYSYNNYKKIYAPIFLKKILKSDPYKKIFKNLNFSYYSYHNVIIFNNVNYLTLVPHHKENKYLKKTLNYLNKKIKVTIKTEFKYTIISRSKTNRILLNEKELFSSLKKYNFKIYNFENISQKKQIEIIKNSKIVIGYQGSNFTNVCYMEKNSHLIDISNFYINNSVFKIISKLRKFNYYNINCQLSYKNLNAFCDIQKIEKLVRKIMFENK